MVNSIVITAGEPSGIGPDLVLQLARQQWPVQLVICSDKNLLAERARLLNEKVTFIDYAPEKPAQISKSGTLTVAQWQPFVFAIGVAGTSLFMMGAGTLGVSRRHWDITFAEAPLAFDYPGTAFLMMGLNGIFGVLAGVGGLMYIVVVVGSILFGKRRGAAEVKAHPIVADSGTAATHYGSEGTLKLPGTITLVGIFFLAFVLYYFINWKFLSEVWPLS